MGLNYPILNFMLINEVFATNGVIKKDILEIGKLKNSLTKKEIKYLSKKFHINKGILNSDAKSIYEYLGCKGIDSLDNSSFEGANVLKNLNIPPIEGNNTQSGRYDVVIDGGTTEHIYNPVVAIANYLNLLKVGGSLIQFLPVNNYIDHGLYQFSPTFFWSIKQRGVEIRKLHFVERTERNKYYWDGLSLDFKKHVDKSYDGSGLGNLFRFRSSNVIALAQWVKTDVIDYKDFIENSNQEIYSNKWQNTQIESKLKRKQFYEAVITYIYNCRNSLVKTMVANCLLMSKKQMYK